MRPRDLLDMLLIGAIWGGAFPMLWVAAPAFGPVALIGVRVAVAAVVLLALLRARGRLLERAGPLFVLAMLAFFWVGERLSAWQVLGIALGFGGIATIVWNEIGSHAGTSGTAVAAGLVGAALYGAAASFARRRLDGVAPIVVATGCVCGAALAYVLYFRLLPRIGAARAVTVTFLIPVFGVAWGALLLGEPLTLTLLAGSAVVLVGTALAMGLVRPSPGRAASR